LRKKYEFALSDFGEAYSFKSKKTTFAAVIGFHLFEINRE
jgi:hypothetical protein